MFLAPDENPTDVKGLGTGPGNLVISWTVSLGLHKSASVLLDYQLKAVYSKEPKWFLLFCSSAQPLTGFQSNGPGLEYRVQWRQLNAGGDWSIKNVANVSQFVVSGTPTYVSYEIRVQAINDYGSGPEPETVIGYSGEDREQTYH